MYQVLHRAAQDCHIKRFAFHPQEVPQVTGRMSCPPREWSPDKAEAAISSLCKCSLPAGMRNNGKILNRKARLIRFSIQKITIFTP